ncbi:MAG TPA: GerMN domain-containing protein [Pyrinomonadaceae bacterium]|nr:GerMN domain-containing protein [Pyrinomonadaceae bacterium]
MRSLLLCIIATVSLSPLGMLTRAQTAKDFRSKYGPPSEVFQINPGLSLTAKYTDEGLACEVDIVQRDVVIGSTLVSNNLPDPKTARYDLGRGVKRIIAEVMPEASKRGRTISTGKGQIGNCYGSSTDDYELVKVSRTWEDCGARSYSARIVWKTRRCKGTPVPVVSRDIELWVYFTNPKLPEWANTCGAGEFVLRKVAPTKRTADAALRLLFAGPNVSEQAKGMEGLGPLGEYYRGVSIKDGVAVVNFRPGAEKYLHVSGAACQQEQVLTPIVKTLKRFSSIKSVDFAINGKIIEEWDA